MLQAKEATASVLSPYLETSHHANHGERVVVGQRLMQATADIFLGWTRGPAGRDFYFRQLWDMKGSVDTTTLRPPGMGFYGGLCARSLARAHARSGDAIAIAAYLGTSDTFDGAIADFAEAYADQNELDYQAFTAAIAGGQDRSRRRLTELPSPPDRREPRDASTNGPHRADGAGGARRGLQRDRVLAFPVASGFTHAGSGHGHHP